MWRKNRREAALLVAAHHGGLEGPGLGRPWRKKNRNVFDKGMTVCERTENFLDEYENRHEKAGLPAVEKKEEIIALHDCGFTRRLALSCLVDADHEDTAVHCNNEQHLETLEGRWRERLRRLDEYIADIAQESAKTVRNRLRSRVYNECNNALLEPSIYACDASVGSGKTTAIMAHLLRVAEKYKLRHIIVVLPYTSIIKQSVDIYRKALVLPGENAKEVIAEHHHMVDFNDSLTLRGYATLWKSPIIVTTAVQFFETLGGSRPSRLRKLHELPGSAVFIDEAHAAIPSHLWPITWCWLKEFTDNWSGYLVLASGSLSHFWNISRFQELVGQQNITVPNLISPDLRKELEKYDRNRIVYKRRSSEEKALTCEELIKFVNSKPGPRLVVVNTKLTAAVIARTMRESGCDVLHLSTALTPAHREEIVDEIENRLEDKSRKEWTLVATSCVECGMGFSFRTGFRERAATSSLIQLSGRVNREGEYGENMEVWDILLRDRVFSNNVSLRKAISILSRYKEEYLNDVTEAPGALSGASRLSTGAMEQELSLEFEDLSKALMRNEEQLNYQEVSHLCRVIEQDMVLVVIDEDVWDELEKGKSKKTIRNRLVRGSVRMPKTVKEAGGKRIKNIDDEIYKWWDQGYDNFIGYMKGVLELKNIEGRNLIV